MPFSNPLPPTIGFKSKVSVALLPVGNRTKPVASALTISGAVSKGATSITLSASVGSTIEAGQWLAFVDPNDLVYPVKVATTYAATGTSLVVVAVAEAIPTAAVAAFPVPFNLRQSANVDRSTAVTSFSTLDHDGKSDATPGETSSSSSFDGAYSHADPGGKTLEVSQELGRECFIAVSLPAPSAAYSAGEVIEGSFLVETMPKAIPLTGEVTRNISGQWTSYTRNEPVPTA